MACGNSPKFLIGSILLVANLHGLGLQAFVTASSGASFPSPEILAQAPAPNQTTPLYLPKAPPPRVSPLPNQRQQIEERSITSDYRISSLQPDSRGGLWVGSWQGLARINPKTGHILSRISLPNATVGALAQDRVGRIWVGTYEGLVRVDPRTGAITAQNFSLPSNRVLSLLIDKRGYLWVGTDNGLVMISPDQGLIMTTVKNLPGVSANALSIDGKGNLWVGTLDGLVQINTASAMVMRRVTDLPGTTVQALTSRSEAIPQVAPPVIAQTPAAKPAPRSTSQRTRGGSSNAASRRKPAKPVKPKPLPPIIKSYLWVGTPSGLIEVDAGTGQILQTIDALNGRSVTALRFDRTDRLWVGTVNGLLRLNPTSGQVDGRIATNLPSSHIVALFPDVGGKLWVGTSQGLAWVSMQTFQTGIHNTFSRR
ncbi:ligand-binding sensor domain-containing protein [Leptothermofonsia sp. ETS-13]|uniref:ligand-binding sensor domain-containing protein n=1 Tax=Leptothermofonsia sp. ETS-13 TaxID=3035696 RepID=UPI003BA02918